MKPFLMGILFLIFHSTLGATEGSREELLSKISSDLDSVRQKSQLSESKQFSILKGVGLELRELAPRFHLSLIEDIEVGKPLHGSQLTLMHKIVGTFVNLDYQYLKLSKRAQSRPLKLLVQLERYRNFSIIYRPYYSNKKFRRLVNAQDSSFDVEKKELKKLITDLIKRKNIKQINKEVASFKRDVKARIIERDEAYVHDVIEHEIIDTLKDERVWKGLRKKKISQTLSDFRSNTGDAVVHFLSGAFGNGAGSIRWRKGHLLNNKEVTQEIKSILKPLDIITEKVRFALTDAFIPGHFGHNAIWLGTPAQLKELDLWEHPVIRPHHKQLLAGNSIIETDRSGTHFKSLEAFMNVDEFGLLRLKPEVLNIETEKKKVIQIYRVALAQLGKTYDFNFDVETTDQLVCSELLYQAFGDVNWPTEDYIGRTTISPDNIVSLALYNNAPIDLIYYVQGLKNGGVVLKDLENLANDVGFKKIDDEYQEGYRHCETVKMIRTGSRGSETIAKRSCETRYQRRNYTHHRSLPYLTLSL